MPISPHSDVRWMAQERSVSPVTRRLVDLSTHFRRKRFAFFRSLIASLPRPLTILDIGGTQSFWETVGFLEEDVTLTLVNLKPIPVTRSNVISLYGDATYLPQFEDHSFDIVFSNSVLDHLTTFENQRRMAREVQRISQRYFVQVPYRYTPIEPHFLWPGFQFYPLRARVQIAMHASGWSKQISHFVDQADARRFLQGIRLMTAAELRTVFPGCSIYHERVGGLTKSLIAYQGF